MGWHCEPCRWRASLGLHWPFTPIAKMATVKCEFMTHVTSEEIVHHNKVSIIGAESVCTAQAVTMLLEGLSDEQAFVDVDEANRRVGQRVLNVAVLA